MLVAERGGVTMRTALCQEWIGDHGGSEQVAARIAEVLDADDIFAFTVKSDVAAEQFGGRPVHSTPLGRTGTARRHHEWYLPVMASAWRRVDLRGYDLVVTSAHSCVNAVRPPAATVHLSYCHTPMRYAWQWRDELGRVPAALRPLWPAVAAGLRRADRHRSRRVDAFIVNSRFVGGRVLEAYGRQSLVIHPPVDTSYWTPGTVRRGEYLLYAGRLVSYKRPDLAVDLANATGLPLVVAGAGPMASTLRASAGPTVRFVDAPDNAVLRELYRGARALILGGTEDFGMTMVEAQACATPVVAVDRGGAKEIVLDGRTGVLADAATVDGLARAVADLDHLRLSPGEIRRNAERFSPHVFTSAWQHVLRLLGDGVAPHRLPDAVRRRPHPYITTVPAAPTARDAPAGVGPVAAAAAGP